MLLDDVPLRGILRRLSLASLMNPLGGGVLIGGVLLGRS